MVSIFEVEAYHELTASPNRKVITDFINSGWFTDKDLPIEEMGKMIDNYINNKK